MSDNELPRLLVRVDKLSFEDLPSCMEMEQADDAREFVIPNQRATHEREYQDSKVLYLSILDKEELKGFIILCRDSDEMSVEFRRIVVTQKDRGTGQRAIIAMHHYCSTVLRCKRIWLDVFATNRRGRHIYEKLGYTLFKQGQHEGTALLYYEKML